ncbi:MAG: hypothetical protein IT192_06795 [Microbacteriaceae bacterium]|nr:hypothetical protein [Microbacteriaceae bacterium]
MHRQAFDVVLAWVRDIAEDSPALRPIPGASAGELQRLARFCALLKSRLTEDASGTMVDALTVTPSIEPSAGVDSAFDVLLNGDVVVNLANLYAAIVRPASRRRLGTFFTPRAEATAIIDGYASRHNAPSVVVDVGAGVGIFSEIAQAKWPSAEIYAIDINPVTLALQAVAALRRPEWKVHFELDDYRRWLATSEPNDAVLYLGNPPYTRWQLLDDVDRASLLIEARGLVGARANLSTLILGMTLTKLRPQDSLAMIIPAGWMRAEYGKSLRAHLRAAKFRQISLRMADSWRFEKAIVDAVLVEVGPELDSHQGITVSDWSGSEKLRLSREGGNAAFPAPGRAVTISNPVGTNVIQLAELAKSLRGTASGANRFFIKMPQEWEALGVAKEYRQPLARRLRPCTEAADPALESAELLVLSGYSRGTDAQIDSWIDLAEAAGVNSGYLCKKRACWFDLSSEVRSPDVIISAFAQNVFHVIENPGELAIMNNLFGLCWRNGVDVKTQRFVVAWLRSPAGQTALRATASIEANGLRRLSPKMIGTIVLPDPAGAGNSTDSSLTYFAPVVVESR